jgi:hypothetical protein
VLVQVETPNSPACEATSSSSHSTIAIEPGCHSHHPRSSSWLRALKPWAYGCWLLDRHIVPAPVITPTTSWPAIRMRKSTALRSIEITGTKPVMTSEGAVGGCEGRTYPPIHAVSLTALILRSRCKRRLEGGSGEHRKRAVLRDASLLRRAPICGFPHRHGRAGPGHPDQTSAAFPSSGSPAPIPGPSPGRGRGEAGHDDIRHAPAPRSRPDPRSFPAREQSVRQTAPGPVPRRRAMFTPSARRKIIFPPFTTHMIEESRLIPP